MKNAKKYNQLIEFWSTNQVSNGQGGTYVHYMLDFADYAHIITKDETRTLQEGQLILEGYFEVYLRYRSDISIAKSHNIKMKGKNLTIHSIVNIDELNKEFKLIASESDNSTDIPEDPYQNYQ
ncbi:phage head completion protein [Pedobacter immunditicola]|uniref:phage head completion protein n=1 Tax=Pedobacter immunditicola TaxID=3133440 RepID=UPI0030AB8ABE